MHVLARIHALLVRCCCHHTHHITTGGTRSTARVMRANTWHVVELAVTSHSPHTSRRNQDRTFGQLSITR
eukprot:1156561-Pelagomonas_calceolata.AAC.7